MYILSWDENEEVKMFQLCKGTCSLKKCNTIILKRNKIVGLFSIHLALFH